MQQLVVHDFAIMPRPRSNGSADHDMKHLLTLSPQESEDKRKDEVGSNARYSHMDITKSKTDTTTASSKPSLFKQGITTGYAGLAAQ
jgi:hypothetical protein